MSDSDDPLADFPDYGVSSKISAPDGKRMKELSIGDATNVASEVKPNPTSQSADNKVAGPGQPAFFDSDQGDETSDDDSDSDIEAIPVEETNLASPRDSTFSAGGSVNFPSVVRLESSEFRNVGLIVDLVRKAEVQPCEEKFADWEPQRRSVLYRIASCLRASLGPQQVAFSNPRLLAEMRNYIRLTVTTAAASVLDSTQKPCSRKSLRMGLESLSGLHLHSAFWNPWIKVEINRVCQVIRVFDAQLIENIRRKIATHDGPATLRKVKQVLAPLLMRNKTLLRNPFFLQHLVEILSHLSFEVSHNRKTKNGRLGTPKSAAKLVVSFQTLAFDDASPIQLNRIFSFTKKVILTTDDRLISTLTTAQGNADIIKRVTEEMELRFVGEGWDQYFRNAIEDIVSRDPRAKEVAKPAFNLPSSLKTKPPSSKPTAAMDPSPKAKPKKGHKKRNVVAFPTLSAPIDATSEEVDKILGFLYDG